MVIIRCCVAGLMLFAAVPFSPPFGVGSPQSQAPVFRTRVELVQLDVTVLDRNRGPVAGLTKDDFTILEDGKPRPIVAFSSFQLDTSAVATGWMREIPPDVTSNELNDSRLFVIVIDDALIPQEPASIRDTKKILTSIVNRLASNDLTAVIFTGDNRRSQDFTNDKTKLLAAIENFNPGLAGYRFGMDAPSPQQPPSPSRTAMGGRPPRVTSPIDVDLSFFQSSVRTLENVAEYLSAVPGKRKALFWVSPGVPLDVAGAIPRNRFGEVLMPASELVCLVGAPTVQDCLLWRLRLPPTEMLDLQRRTDAAFLKAQRANVTIYPIDPTGLDGQKQYLLLRLGAVNEAFAHHKATAQQDFLVAAAANTGGRPIINTNDWEPGIRDAFVENSSYYLIAFEAGNTTPDGKLHKIKVEVNRPDVEIRTRTGYWAPRAEELARKRDSIAELTAEAAELAKAIGGLLPNTGLPMKVALAPFAVAGQRLSTVTVVIGVRQPIPAAAAKGRLTETTELITSAFTPEGAPRGSQRHTARVTLRPGSDGEASYEVLGRIDLPPGRYRLRMAAHNAASGRTGSVFADVIVPDYSDARSSVSPVVLGSNPGRASAPRDLFSNLLPFVPTAERTFTKDDRVTSLVRLYQNGRGTVERADVVIRILDASDAEVASERRGITADRFAAAGESLIVQTPASNRPAVTGRPTTPPPAPGADAFANLSLRSADVQYQLPTSRLVSGQYLLTLEVTIGTAVIQRTVRFAIK